MVHFYCSHCCPISDNTKSSVLDIIKQDFLSCIGVDSTASPNTMQITTDIHEDEDVHICAKCKIPFTSLEAYFEHKMTSKTCGKEFNNTRKSLLKRLGPRRGRPPGRKRQSHDSPYTPAIVKKEPPGEGMLRALYILCVI